MWIDLSEWAKSMKIFMSHVNVYQRVTQEFRIMIVKMIKDLGKRMEAKIEKMQEMFNKDLEELKNKQRGTVQ